MLTNSIEYGTIRYNQEREKIMTMIKKKFTSIDDGINNMLDAAAYDYKLMGSKYRTSEEFREKFMINVGKKYIKISRFHPNFILVEL